MRVELGLVFGTKSDLGLCKPSGWTRLVREFEWVGHERASQGFLHPSRNTFFVNQLKVCCERVLLVIVSPTGMSRLWWEGDKTTCHKPSSCNISWSTPLLKWLCSL